MLKSLIKFNSKLILLTLLALCLCLISPKIIERSINVVTFRRSGGWIFLDRMMFAPGKIYLNINIGLNSKQLKIGRSYNLQIAAVPHTLWQKESLKKCNIQKYTQSQKQIKASQQFTNFIVLNEENQYRNESKIQKQYKNEIAFNFILRDCENSMLKDDLGRNTNIELRIDIRNNQMLNSATQNIYKWFLPFKIMLGIILVAILRKDKQEDGYNWVKIFLISSITFEIISILFKYIGFLIYAYLYGQDYSFFDFCYLLFHSVSDSIIMVLLMLLSFGWTVTFRNTNDFDLYVPLASLLGLVNVIMTTLNKVTDGDHDKYHLYDSVPAYIMLFFKFIAFCIFSTGIIRSLLDQKSKEAKIKSYFIQLGILGTIYLTFLPIILIFASYIDSFKRKQFVFCVIQVMKFLIYFWITFLCASKKSIYRNLIDSSFMQKGDKYY